MRRISLVSAICLVIFTLALSCLSAMQQFKFRRPKGALQVVDFFQPEFSLLGNYAVTVVQRGREKNWVAGLAEDCSPINDTKMECKSCRSEARATFHF